MTTEELKYRQNLDLDTKIAMTNQRIFEWYYRWGGEVYISFSGGKDSTVLLDIVRKEFPNVEGVFVDTGLEYPEIRQFVKTIPNVRWIKPKVDFKTVLDTYGYPVISKEQSRYICDVRSPTTSEKLKDQRLNGKNFKISKKWRFLLEAPFKISDKCCYKLKKEPIARYEKETGNKPFIGTMAEESMQRKTAYLKSGCNSFNSTRPKSTPMAFWTTRDVWDYISKYNIKYSSIYDMGYNRTGCMFCMYGVHCEKNPNRFELMKKTHPQMYQYCISKLGCGKVLDYINVKY